MSFLDWMNMSMAVDIAFLVFAAAVVWKFKKTESKIKLLQQNLELVAKNPKNAKRVLKEMK